MLWKLLIASVGLAYAADETVTPAAPADPADPANNVDNTPEPTTEEEEKPIIDGDKVKEEFIKRSAKTACYVYTDLEYYNLMPLQEGREKWQVTADNGHHYSFNFCEFKPLCSNRPEDFTLAANEWETSEGKTAGCEVLSGDDLGDISRKLVQTGDTTGKSLYITYKDGDYCDADETKTHEVEIRLVCKTKTDADIKSIDISDPCKTIITMHTKHGCPRFSSTAIVQFLSANPWVLGIVLIVFGGIVCFFGRKFFQFTLAALGFILGAGVSLLVFSFATLLDGLETDDSPLWLAIVMIIVAILIGVLCAFLLFKTWTVGACIFGAVAGVLGMITLYNTVFHATESFWLLFIMIILGAVGGVLLTRRYFDMLVIISTSLVGAYAFVRGFSVFIGNYPNELVLFNKLMEGVKVEFDNYFYVYLGVMVAVFILGFMHQRQTLLKEGDSFKKV